MKILLLGGITGMLAHDIERVLQQEAIEYISIPRSSISFSNKYELRASITQHMPTHIINTIAFTQVDDAEDKLEEAYTVNVTFSKYLACICNELDIELIHYSTDFVFDGNTVSPYTEKDTPHPINIYGTTKYEGEREILQHCMKSYIISTAWLFGISKENFITKILRKVQQVGSISVVADQYGCPTYTKELAYATLPFLTENIEYGIYHVTNQGEASWFSLASYAVACYNKIYKTDYTVHPILSLNFPQKAKRPEYSVLNTQYYTEQTQHTLPHWRESVYEFINEYTKSLSY